jgi:arsenate reductase
MQVTLYHNPRCSKSRDALAILKKQKVDIEIIEYLKSPLNSSTLKEILSKLGGSAHQLIRTNEKKYRSLNLAQADDDRIISTLAAHPNLLQRPIIVSKTNAVIGRPPEKVLSVL